MQTIKDKIDIFSNQVEGFTEQADMEEAEETPTVSLYTVVDQEDPIDVLVGAAVTERFANVTISRQTPGIYVIAGKQVTLEAQGEENDQLKVRVGSSWLNFVDYLAQAKARIEREGEDDGAVGADLEAAGEDSSAAAAGGKSAPAKKKKKKKAKKARPELDLDMDNDVASEQTRFAGLVKTQGNEEESKDATEQATTPKESARRSERGKRPVGLTGAIVEEDEDENEDSEEAKE